MFNEQFTVQIRDINYGNHLDHLSLLGYLHETRVRYLKSIDCTELNIDGNNTALITCSLTCNYKKECFHGDIIKVQLDLCKESELRLVFKYIVTSNDKIVANAEITVAFLNDKQRLTKIPTNLKNYLA